MKGCQQLAPGVDRILRLQILPTENQQSEQQRHCKCRAKRAVYPQQTAQQPDRQPHQQNVTRSPAVHD